ncbi:histidinol-phosphate transaminase [Litorimonas sp. RW-G-Af-16]|uniref:histidinol-phosphate transaminase n=1 Tax=Litorimonas sp. RW-G-Af-16 TaxID=3241168 RepID=UPI00390C9763
MSDFPKNIARKAVLNMKAYSARGGATDALHLDANENPYAPPPVIGAKNYNRYPEQQPPALVARLAGLYGVSTDMVMVGRGADEGIEILLRTFCESEDNILICPPTFGYYRTCAEIQGCGIVEAPLNDDFSWNHEAIFAAADAAQNLKAIFICTPNNPSGNECDADLVEALAKRYPDTFIAVDEAYQEFTTTPSYTVKIAEYPNIIVMRTLSKAYALAGVRGGVAIADPRVIDLMLKVLPPYPIARPVEEAILKALAPSAMSVHADRLAETLEQRDRLAAALPSSPFVKKVYPSAANFLLMELSDDAALFAELAKRNVKIRDYRATTGKVRLSIGSPEENTIALAAFGINQTDAKTDRIGEVFRKTNETDISVRVNLDDSRVVKINTGIGFYDHMLEQIAKHGGMGLTMTCKGDLEIDAHHSVEDTALAFGTALKQALGNKAGIGRYGFTMPMDETQARVAIDLSGRPAAVFKGKFPTDHVGEFPVEMCPHFFESLAQTLGAAIHIDVEGDNSHHMIEACFKGVGRALRPALSTTISMDIPSTKGVL